MLRPSLFTLPFCSLEAVPFAIAITAAMTPIFDKFVGIRVSNQPKSIEHFGDGNGRLFGDLLTRFGDSCLNINII